MGLCVSQEVKGGKPTDLGDVMSKKVDAIRPLEVGKGKYLEIGKSMPQEKGKKNICSKETERNISESRWAQT